MQAGEDLMGALVICEFEISGGAVITRTYDL
jgi:hypothetical protein